MNDTNKWDIASQALKAEFGLDADEMPSVAGIKEIFFEITEPNNLSQNACNALMYGLYFYGYVSLLDAMYSEDKSFELPDLSGINPVLESADVWAQKAQDAELLNKLSQPIIKYTQELLIKLKSVKQ